MVRGETWHAHWWYDVVPDKLRIHVRGSAEDAQGEHITHIHLLPEELRDPVYRALESEVGRHSRLVIKPELPVKKKATRKKVSTDQLEAGEPTRPTFGTDYVPKTPRKK